MSESEKTEILVVEDETSMQILLKHLLTRAGFDVTMAANGMEAKDVLAKRRFDIVCSDVMMSGIDGIQLCTWVKQQEGLKDIPFVILSSRAQHGEKELGIQAGADAYLTKPFDIHDLLATIQKVLGRTTN
jgi:two-component system alkaline phosphatase synthesis response regulator PhoP